MSKPFLPEVNYMRGIAMLGVIGIHVGSYALTNLHANAQLIAGLEILTRFSIPTFFFLSGLGIFYNEPVHEPFSYSQFIKRRLPVVLVPYVVWSFIYLAYTGFMSQNWSVFKPGYVLTSLFFGTGGYHLYFLVILLWFYLLMPLWRGLVKIILRHPILWMLLLFLFQIGINFISSYRLGGIHLESPVLQYFLSMRLNYWVIHYAWIFLMGAVVAENYDAITIRLLSLALPLTVVFTLSVAFMLGAYYYVLFEWHYTLLEAVYTIHQLSPMGMIYTGTSCIFLLYMFKYTPWVYWVKNIWASLGKASYGMYLVHPLVLYFLIPAVENMGYTLSAPVIIVTYAMTVVLSYVFAAQLLNAPTFWRRLLLGH